MVFGYWGDRLLKEQKPLNPLNFYPSYMPQSHNGIAEDC